MRRTTTTALAGLILLTTGTRPARAETPLTPPAKPKLVAQYDLDTRNFNVLSFTLQETPLPLGMTLWGFTDLKSTQNDAQNRFDLSNSFSEYRFSHAGAGKWLRVPGLGLQVEYNDFTPAARDARLRAGMTFKHSLPIPVAGPLGGLPGWLQWRGFPVESKGDERRQASLIYYLPLHKRVVIAGFADLNILKGVADRWVVEPQLNVKLKDGFWAILEFRYNDFERLTPGQKSTGCAFGVRMDIF